MPRRASVCKILASAGPNRFLRNCRVSPRARLPPHLLLIRVQRRRGAAEAVWPKVARRRHPIMMGLLPKHLLLIITVAAAPETTVHEQIRSALATGEAALQASRWRASSDAYV